MVSKKLISWLAVGLFALACYIFSSITPTQQDNGLLGNIFWFFMLTSIVGILGVSSLIEFSTWDRDTLTSLWGCAFFGITGVVLVYAVYSLVGPFGSEMILPGLFGFGFSLMLTLIPFYKYIVNLDA